MAKKEIHLLAACFNNIILKTDKSL